MPILNINKTYADEEVLTSADLDQIKDSIETFINDIKLGDSNITNGGISSANIQSGAISTSKFASEAITTAKIVDEAITTNKIADEAITTAQIANSTITESKIVDNTFDRSRAPLNTSTTTTASSGAFNVTSSYTAITNLSYTANSNKTLLFYLFTESASSSTVDINLVDAGYTTDNIYVNIGLYKTSTASYIAETRVGKDITFDHVTSGENFSGNLIGAFFVEETSAATTYVLHAKVTGTVTSATITNLKMRVIEL